MSLVRAAYSEHTHRRLYPTRQRLRNKNVHLSMVLEEVQRQKEVARCPKAVSKAGLLDEMGDHRGGISLGLKKADYTSSNFSLLNGARDASGPRTKVNFSLSYNNHPTNKPGSLVQIWSYVIKMTLLWEEAIDEAYQQQKQQDRGWTVKLHPFEVGCRGYVASSTSRLLREIGVRGQAHRRAIKYLAETDERSIHWLWLKRKDAPRLPRHPADHKTHRLDQPVVGRPLQRVSCVEMCHFSACWAKKCFSFMCSCM